MVNPYDESLDEKYRPKGIAEVVGQSYLEERVKDWTSNGKIPHLIFTGPPGVGKTTVSRVLARELFGKDWRCNLHEFNAADERGIGFIRRDVGSLIRTVPIDASFQIIFLDEADSLTHEAQDALKEMMQRHTDTSKFILCCNNLSKIIEPIQGRCAIFRFEPIPRDTIVERLKYICGNEKIGYEEGALEVIAEQSEGSMRKAILCIDKYIDKANRITLKNAQIYEPTIKDLTIKHMIQEALDGNTLEYEKLLKGLYYGKVITETKILNESFNIIKNMEIEPSLKRALINEIGIYEARISQPNSDKLLQLHCYLNSLSMLNAKK